MIEANGNNGMRVPMSKICYYERFIFRHISKFYMTEFLLALIVLTQSQGPNVLFHQLKYLG